MRQTLPEEEVLRLRNPALYAFVMQQDLFELNAAATVIRNAIKQYRSSFVVRRNLRRMFLSVGVIQRFVRTLSRRRSSALQRIIKDWCALEAAFVSRLQRHRPVDNDVVDTIVTKVVMRHAVTPSDEKRRRIEDAWRASRWEIAVAWRISNASARAAAAAGCAENSLSLTSSKNNENGGGAASSPSLTRRNSSGRLILNVVPSPEYESWALKRESVQRRVFSYFISAAPLFEAARRRLAVHCGFAGRRSVFCDPEMMSLLRSSGISVSLMQQRRREMFLHEAQQARAKMDAEIGSERAMLMAELTRRAEAGTAAAVAATASASWSDGDAQFNSAMAMVRKGGVVLASNQPKLKKKMMMSPAESAAHEQRQRFFSISSDGADDQLPERPNVYDTGTEASTILAVLRETESELLFFEQPDPFDELSASLRASVAKRDAHRSSRRRDDQQQNPQLAASAINLVLAPPPPRRTREQQQHDRKASSSPRGRSRSVTLLAEQQKEVLRRGIALPWMKDHRAAALLQHHQGDDSAAAASQPASSSATPRHRHAQKRRSVVKKRPSAGGGSQ